MTQSNQSLQELAAEQEEYLAQLALDEQICAEAEASRVYMRQLAKDLRADGMTATADDIEESMEVMLRLVMHIEK